MTLPSRSLLAGSYKRYRQRIRAPCSLGRIMQGGLLSRSGFTLIELAIAIVIIGILVIVAFPRMQDWLLRESVRAARRTMTTHMARARTIAIHRGCRAVLNLDPATSRVWVTACTVDGTGTEAVGTVDDFTDRFGVTFEADGASLEFTPQGLAFATSSLNLTFSKGGYSTSLEITPVGRPVW